MRNYNPVEGGGRVFLAASDSKVTKSSMRSSNRGGGEVWGILAKNRVFSFSNHVNLA